MSIPDSASSEGSSSGGSSSGIGAGSAGVGPGGEAGPDGGARVRVRAVALGPFQTNCYVVWVEEPGGARPSWIVDAGFEPRRLIELARSEGLTPELLILTHAHADHLAGVDEVLGAFAGMKLAQHEAEAAWLGDAELNLSAGMGVPVTVRRRADRVLMDGDELMLGSFRWVVRHTPGHSPGSVTLWCPGGGVALVGDTLFAGSVGRTDFPGCDFATLERSIRAVLYALPVGTQVLPGHGPTTTIGRERATNPYLRG